MQIIYDCRGNLNEKECLVSSRNKRRSARIVCNHDFFVMFFEGIKFAMMSLNFFIPGKMSLWFKVWRTLSALKYGFFWGFEFILFKLQNLLSFSENNPRRKTVKLFKNSKLCNIWSFIKADENVTKLFENSQP